jgi:glucokinase
VNALNLPMVVVGGGVSSAWDAFSPAMTEEVRRRSFVYSNTAPEKTVGRATLGQTTVITRALLGSDAGLFGAARIPMLEEEVREMATMRREPVKT